MIFKKRKSPDNTQPSQERYFLEMEMEDFCSPSRQTWEMSEMDLEAPKSLVVEWSELESICLPSVSYEMEDLKIPVVSVDLKELVAIEEKWKSRRKTFILLPEHQHPFSFHGTRSKENARSICKNGWKVGHGNAIGSGIYFGFTPGAKKRDKNKIPVPGLPFRSNTAADSYASGSGALIIAEVDWGNSVDWYNGKVQQEFSKWCAKTRNKYSGGDAITEWGLANGYDSVKCSGGVGVMLQHRYSITKKYWKTDKIRICYVYSMRDKKVEKLT